MKNLFFLFLLTLSLMLLHFGCQKNSTESKVIFDLENFELSEMNSPVKSGGEPNLFVSEKGNVYLSWVEYVNWWKNLGQIFCHSYGWCCSGTWFCNNAPTG